MRTRRPSPSSVAPDTPGDLHQRIAQRLDDDFPLPGDAIDQRCPTAAVPGADHDHVHPRPRRRLESRTAAPAGRPAAPLRDASSARCSRSPAASAASISRDLVHRRLRHRKRPIADMDDQRVGDGQRQRQHRAKRGARPSAVSTVSVPPRSWTVSRTTAMPTPRPLPRSASSRVENPGAQIKSSSGRGVDARRPATVECRRRARASRSPPRPCRGRRR